MSELPDFQPYKRLGRKTKEVRSPTQALGRPKYGGTAGRSDKRALSTSPGYSPNSKQSRPNTQNIINTNQLESSSTSERTATTPPGENSVTERKRAAGAQAKA